ncbi:MAG TPA: CheR family methyltransferase [Tenuifilaceae bacterium]|nr:CheR family methyltransferase [Tenuifilaceae bacterium]HPI44079.1 CheR family methyltransferase [Tenuifilaceae bacterium]HPN21186.1 CheR family methyltransferase [Tenuifilaceae bacterium]
MIRYEIGIVDTRNVIKVLLDDFGFDFRDYALTSFKRRLEHVINNNGLRDADGLIARLQNNKDFIEQFLFEITPETTEMFRDPSFWRMLRDEILPEVVRGSASKPRIWLASFDSGEELYSLAIILKEMNLLDSVQVYANVFTEKCINRIKSGRLDPKDLETNEANYQRLNGKFQYSSYYKMDGNAIIFDTELVKNVNFVKQKTSIENDPGAVKLTIFRNQTIYYNQLLHEKVLQKILTSMVAGGFLALGVKETLENTNAYNKFTVFNDNEKIYKRKTT